MAIKILLGGSPCTHWSIAKGKDRETKAEGLGWELFENYLIAKEKFQPDIFLYENNKSASQAIKDQIANELGVGVDPNARFTYINSALVSAQNRQRFYVTNFGDIEQPEDRGIRLRDILETGCTDRDKAHAVLGSAGRTTTREYFDKYQGTMVCEPVEPPKLVPPCDPRGRDKARTITAGYQTCSQRDLRMDIETEGFMGKQGVIEAVNVTKDGKSQTIKAQYQNTSPRNICCYHSTYGASGVAEPIGCATPCEWDENDIPTKAISCADGKTYTVYEVKDGFITIKGKQYPIDLPDGYYIIRKLTVTECCRLQTLPDDYVKAVSASQGYKGVGNGWTAEIIIHILNHALKDVPRDEELIVLSMYDGIGTGMYCLKKMGFTNIKYYAYENDPYPITIAMDNHPEIMQRGDAFAVRNTDWRLE